MIRGVHVLMLAAVVLAAVATRATEVYAARYQSLPALDWVESRPPLTESTHVPAATALARGMARALPLLVIRDDARTRLPGFGPPPGLQRTISGVRDASRVWLGSPGSYPTDEVPITARFDVIVFNRVQRAVAWSELMGRAMDSRDPENGLPQARMAGPEEQDMVWVAAPRMGGGVATVVGNRGTIGFVLQISYFHAPTADAAVLADLSARAEVLARGAAADWSASL
ncbi:MAG TPA: hypothetical protein VF937_05880 [Chloroflexota bacterium]